MTDGPEYEVGYGKPPKHSRFVPGQSGFKGRRKPKETPAEMVRRVRDELVTAGGKEMTKLEVAIHSALSQTIKSGRSRDINALFALLDKYGAIPKVDEAAKSKEAADRVMERIADYIDKVHDIDPQDEKALKDLNEAEAKLVMGCEHCGPVLRTRWADQAYRAVRKRLGPTHIHRQVVDAAEAKNASPT